LRSITSVSNANFPGKHFALLQTALTVSHDIHLLPSGKSFTAQPRETLLEAGLRAGVGLPYRCDNGSCGECKARVVSGDTREVRPHDYVLTEAERGLGMRLMCCEAASSDVELEVREIGNVEEIPRQQITAKVSKLNLIEDEVMELHLRTPRSQALQFLPGQNVMLTLPGLVPRYRSLASCPCNGTQLIFYIRKVPGDAFSQYVFSHLAKSDQIAVEGPEGRFTLDEESSRPIIFFAYDTGFAPLKSLIEHTMALEELRPMWCYWMTFRPQDHFLDNLCRSWADAVDEFHYAPLSSQEPGPAGETVWREHAAMDRVVEDHPDLSGFDVYITGPQAMVNFARRRFMENGLPTERCFQEVLRSF